MTENRQINRNQILKNAELESELSDLKQHADKMIRGFENFNNLSSNRAIWEMVQNACDLTDKCEIVIDYRHGRISFTHNGKPFTTKSLISLIKQVSGKYGEDSDIPEVGKYGTGFLTTHTFGRKFLIDSVLEAEDACFEIKEFLVDRSPKEWKELSARIKQQKDNVYKLIREGIIVSNPLNRTTFTYLPESKQEIDYIKESSRDLEDYVPIVLTINDRLKKVVIINSTGDELSFERKSKLSIVNNENINLYKTTIDRNGDDIVLFSIIDTKDQIEIILPINKDLELFDFPQRVARLFLYYPLVGSENFGVNFIINSNKFLPTEPRDGIHLKSNKDQVKDQEEKNREIIEKASVMVFDFLKSNVLSVSNPLFYAKINFKRNSDNNLLDDYFTGLQSLWTEEFKLLPLVETKHGFKPANAVCFFAKELIDQPQVFDEIYELASCFYENLPLKSKVEQWSKFVTEWTSNDVKFIEHEDLVNKISEQGLHYFNSSSLIKYYRNLIDEGNERLFVDYPLLPNLDGRFCELSSLRSPQNLTPKLLDIGKVLIPQYIDRLVHESFYFDFYFEPFTRKDFSNTVKTRLDEMQLLNSICLPNGVNGSKMSEIDEAISTLECNFFEALVEYCKLNNNTNSQSKPSQLTKIICRYYSLSDDLIYLPGLEAQEDNLDVRSSRKVLIKMFFNLLELHNEGWVNENISLLFDIAGCNEDSFKDVYLDSKIYPNQANQLKEITYLKRDIDLADEIKDLYDKVTTDTIREKVVNKKFNGFVAEDHFVTNKYLATQIEDSFFGSDIYHINEHSFREDILAIISKLKDPYYSNLFPRLDDKKANLMLDIVTNERTKDDIFSIVLLKEEQLKKLGHLVQDENFEAILHRAALILQQEAEKKSDFGHKYEIGTNIERLIREKLSIELLDRVTFVNDDTLKSSDIQGGQDIIVQLDGNPIYFIEVKSRWNSESSMSMSKLQLQRAVEEIKRYALCAVDVSRYTGSNDRYNLSIEEVLPLTKFVKDIGSSIKPLIESNLVAEKKQYESVHLIDYRGIIPQEVVQSGDDFSEFVDSLAKVINSIAIDCYA